MLIAQYSGTCQLQFPAQSNVAICCFRSNFKADVQKHLVSQHAHVDDAYVNVMSTDEARDSLQQYENEHCAPSPTKRLKRSRENDFGAPLSGTWQDRKSVFRPCYENSWSLNLSQFCINNRVTLLEHRPLKHLLRVLGLVRTLNGVHMYSSYTVQTTLYVLPDATAGWHFHIT